MLATDPLVNEYFPHYLPSEDCWASAGPGPNFSMDSVLPAQEELSVTEKLVAGKPQLQEQLQARAGGFQTLFPNTQEGPVQSYHTNVNIPRFFLQVQRQQLQAAPPASLSNFRFGQEFVAINADVKATLRCLAQLRVPLAFSSVLNFGSPRFEHLLFPTAI